MGELGEPVWQFYRMMSAVLAANLLTVAFVWAMVQYSKREAAEPNNHGWLKGTGGYVAVLFMTFGFLFAGLYAWGFFGSA